MTQNKSVATKVLSIIYLVIYFLFTAFLIATFVTCLSEPNVQLSLSLYLAIHVLIFGSICYGALVVFAIIGLIVSAVKKIKSSVKLFGFYILLPIITELIFFVPLYLYLN